MHILGAANMEHTSQHSEDLALGSPYMTPPGQLEAGPTVELGLKCTDLLRDAYEVIRAENDTWAAVAVPCDALSEGTGEWMLFALVRVPYIPVPYLIHCFVMTTKWGGLVGSG